MAIKITHMLDDIKASVSLVILVGIMYIILNIARNVFSVQFVSC
jgi:hypothetical protein